MAEDSETTYCDICARNGLTSKIKVYQINFEEATKICENENCTYPLGLNRPSGTIINRKFTDIAFLGKKKEPTATPQPVLHKPVPRKIIHRPVKLQPLSSTVPNKTLSPYIPGKPLTERKISVVTTPKPNIEKCKIVSESQQSRVLAVENKTSFSSQNSISHVFNEDRFNSLQLGNKTIYPQWQNKDALCWLDVVMCLFVHNRRFKRSYGENYPGSSVLVTLLKAYEQAVSLVNSPKDSLLTKDQCQIPSNVSEGHTSIEPMDSDIGSPAPRISVCKEVLGDFKRLSVDEDSVKTGAGFQQISSDFLSVVTTHGESSYSRAFEILHNVRESTWKAIQPRLRCKKGQNDSPVFAIPLLIKDNKCIEKLFSMSYSFTLKCSHCGHVKTDQYEKVLPTFPNTSKTFNMAAPAFVRPCFQCETPNQKRIMVYERLSEVIMLHFVEGLPHNNFEKLSFRYNGRLYAVTGLIQYRNDPDHFVAWLRDPIENLWMECDDMKSPVTCFSSTVPDLPANQIHIVMWEVQNASPVHNDNVIDNKKDIINRDQINVHCNIDTENSEAQVNQSDVSMDEIDGNAKIDARSQQASVKSNGGIFMVTLSPSGHLVPVPPQDIGGTPSVCPIAFLPQISRSDKNVHSSFPQPNNLIQNLNVLKNVSFRCLPMPGQVLNGKSEILIPSVTGAQIVSKLKGPPEKTETPGFNSHFRTSNHTSLQENFISKTKSNVSFLRTIKQKRARHIKTSALETNVSSSAAVIDRTDSTGMCDSNLGQLRSSASESSFLSRLSNSTPEVTTHVSAFNFKSKVFAGYKTRSVDEEISRASSPVSENSSRCSSPALSTSSDGVVIQKRKTEVSTKLTNIKRRKSALSEKNCSSLEEVENNTDKSNERLDKELNSECQILQGLYSALNIPIPDKPVTGYLSLDNEVNESLSDLPDVFQLAQFVDNDENSSPDFENFLAQL